MADIYDWSTTAADNDDADSTIGWAEGQEPGTVNNSARAMMKRTKELLNDITYAGTVGGTANAITLTSAIGALASNKIISFKATATNTSTTVTLAVNGLTAKNIRKINDAGSDVALAVGDIANNKRYRLVYDAGADSAAGAWILLNPVQLSAAVGATPITATNNADSAANTVATLDSDRATPGDFDQAYVDVRLSNDAGEQTLCHRVKVQIDDVSDGTEDSSVYWGVMTGGSYADELGLNGSALFPYTDGGLSLGLSTNMWSGGNFSGSVVIKSTGSNHVEIKKETDDNLGGEVSFKKGRAGPATVSADDRLGLIVWQGFDGTSYNGTNSASFGAYAAEGFTASARGSYMTWETTAAGGTTRAVRMRVQTGVYHPSATGGDKGNNTINFGAVYDDNSLLSCYPFDAYLDGAIDDDKWNSKVPDRHIPAVTDDAGNVVEPERIEPRVHEDMRKFKARLGTDTDPLDLDKYIAHWKEKRHLTSLPNENRFDPVKGLPTGAWVQRLVETVEIQAIHISQLHDRLKVLETAAGKV